MVKKGDFIRKSNFLYVEKEIWLFLKKKVSMYKSTITQRIRVIDEIFIRGQ